MQQNYMGQHPFKNMKHERSDWFICLLLEAGVNEEELYGDVNFK